MADEATLHVVIGPPCSGKSTYVREHAQPGEVRVDFDLMAQALGADTPHGSTGGIRRAAFAARQAAIDRCIEESIPAWVIHSNPTQEQIDAYEGVGAEFITMDTDIDTCLERAEQDGRPDGTADIIREWFATNNSDDDGEEEEVRSMPSKSNREYRSFNASNFRQVEDESKPYTVRGYFTTFDDPYHLMNDWDGEPIYEVIDRKAFDNCDMSDVIFQFDHTGAVLARTRNDSLSIGFDNHGGWCEAYLGGSRQGRDTFEAISNGLIDQMSFGFVIAKDGAEWDEKTRTSRLTSISKCFDVSCVSIPANPGTEIHARSYLDGVIEERREQQEVLQRAQQQRRERALAALELAQLR